MKYDLSVPGWMTEPELQAICEISETYQPKTVLEIGAFAGRSAVCWAMNLPDSRITCIDPWEPDRIADVWWMSDDNYVWCPFSAEEKRRSLYSVFLERTNSYPNIGHYRVDSGRFFPIAIRLNLKYDLIFIDGDHSLEGFMSDLRIAETLINEGGIVAMHDWKNPELDHMTRMFQQWCDKRGRTIREWPGTMIAASLPK